MKLALEGESHGWQGSAGQRSAAGSNGWASVARFALGAVAIVVGMTATAGPAAAQSDEQVKQACVKAFDDAQVLREEGKLKAARETLVTCSQTHCPDVVETKCGEWLGEVDKALPSLSITLDPAPPDTSAVQLILDGQPLAGALTGRAITVDPGPHELEIRWPDGRRQTRKLVLATGDKNRSVVFRSEDGQAAAPAPGGGSSTTPVDSGGGLSPLLWVGIGVAAAGTLAGGVTGGLALAKSSEIEEACGGTRCDAGQQDAIDQGEALAHVSTASFALAGAGAVLAVVGLLISGGGEDEAVPAGASAAVRVQPWLGLGGGGLRGWF